MDGQATESDSFVRIVKIAAFLIISRDSTRWRNFINRDNIYAILRFDEYTTYPRRVLSYLYVVASGTYAQRGFYFCIFFPRGVSGRK